MTNSTLLHRQINPNWIQNGKPTSQAFKPTKKDEGRLSTYDGDRFSPEESWLHFNEGGRRSFGVMSVSIQECSERKVPVEPDDKEFDGHVSILFIGLSGSQKKERADILKNLACARNWQYLADSN